MSHPELPKPLVHCRDETYKRAQNPVPQSADLMLRALMKEKLSGNAELTKLIEHFNSSLDRQSRALERQINLHRNPDGWQRAA